MAFALLPPLLAAGNGMAANYTFPGALPTGCSGSGGNYSCGALALQWDDTIAINAPKPATITINGNLGVSNARINTAGAASDLTLVVTGGLTGGSGPRIVANVRVDGAATLPGSTRLTGDLDVGGNLQLDSSARVTGNVRVTGTAAVGYQGRIDGTARVGALTGADSCTYGGAITATSGAISIGGSSTVTGDVTAAAGAVSIAGTVNGNVTASGNLTVQSSARITGNARAGGTATVGWQARIDGTTNVGSLSGGGSVVYGGAVVATSGAISLGGNSSVGGDVTAQAGSITLAGSVQVTGNVTAQAASGGILDLQSSSRLSGCAMTNSTAASSISLGWHANPGGVCCVSGGGCLPTSNACYANSSGYSLSTGACSSLLPATLVAQYRMEDAAWNGASGELKDTAGYVGGPFNGAAIGAPAPTAANAAPARSGSAGTCGYATLPGPSGSGGAFSIPGLPVSTTTGAKTSVAFWMYWDGTDSVMPIGWSGHDLWLQGGSFGFNTANSDLYGIASTGLAGGWHHVAAVFTNGSVTANELYIDGVRQSLSQIRGTPSTANAVVSSTLRLGGWARDTGYRFSGRIDEVKVYNGAVTQAQVTALHSETHACPATLVADWRMDEPAWDGTAAEVADSGSNGYHGQSAGGATTAAGKICQGGDFSFRSTTSQYDRASLDARALNGLTDFSISAWIKTPGASAGTYMAILSGANSSQANELTLRIENASRRIHARIHNTSQYLSNTLNIFDDQWHHLVWTRSGTSHCAYVDGAQASCATIAYTPALDIGGGGLIVGQDQDAIGSSFDVNQDWEGRIDELLIFNGALTAAEVAAAYANQNGGRNWDGSTRSCPAAATLIAQYRLDEMAWNGTAGEVKDNAGHSGGPFDGRAIGTPLPAADYRVPARAGTAGTCGYGAFTGGTNGSAIDIAGLPVSAAAGAKTTVAFWMYWTGAPGVMPIGWRAYDLYFAGSAFGFNTGNGDIYGMASTGLANGWHHVVAVFVNGDATQSKLYIDGAAQALTQRYSTPNNTSAYVQSNLRLSGWTANSDYRFTGLVDEVKVYNGDLSQAQVTSLYNETHACAARPVADWRMDEAIWDGTAGEVADSGGNGYHGQSAGGATTVAGKICQGGDFSFLSTASQYDRASLDARALNGLTDFSISAWIKTPGASTGTYMAILSGANSSQANELTLRIENASRRIHARIHNTSQYLSNTLNIFDDQWHHLVWTRSGTSHCAYVDGAQAACATINYTPALDIGGGGLIVGQDQDAVGSNFDVNQDWEGRIDELLIFNGALTAAEVAAAYGNQNGGRNWDGSARSCSALVAQYRFEDAAAWNGTAGEVADSAGYSGGPYNGRAIGSSLPTQASTGPAKSGSTGTCGYAVLGGPVAGGAAFEYSGLPLSRNFRDKTSVAFWMYWDGTGGVMPIGWGQHDLYISGGNIGFNTFGGDVWGASAAGLANGWHHVVAVFANGDVASNQIYIDGVSKSLSLLGGTVDNANAYVQSTLRAGGTTSQSGYRFTGRIDEVKVYNGRITQAQVTALYNETHSCGSVDHYELSLPTSGIACAPTTVTVTACADSSSPCAVPSTVVGGQTATLAASAGTLGATSVTFNAAGIASTTLAYPAGGTATVTLSGESASAANARKCCPGGANCTVANSCSTDFRTAGFIFSDSATGGAVTIATQTAGKTSGTYYLRAVQTGTTTKKCEAALTGSQSVNFTYACVDPATCTSGSHMTLAGTAFPASGGAPTLSFGATDGAAPFTFSFADAGKISLAASKTVGGATLAGASGNFVVKPAGLCVSTDVAACTASAGQEHTCAAAKKAGAAFGLTVKGVAWQADDDADLCAGNTVTPNYKATGIGLDSKVVAPSGKSDGSLGTGTLAIDSGGSASAANQTLSEVGVFRFSAQPPAYIDGVTLGGDADGKFWSAATGRFTPDHFDVAVGGHGTMAAACGTFTYTGQPMAYGTAPSLTIKPMNALATPTVTTNYVGDFQKLAASGVSITAPTADATQTGKDGATLVVLAATLGAGALANDNGIMTYRLAAADRYTYTRDANSLIAPYVASIPLVVAAVRDSDDVTATAALPTLAPTGGIPVRYGRARLLNANGSELLNLPLSLRLEYFSGATQGWQTNAADTCTTIAAGDFAFAFPIGTTAKPNSLANPAYPGGPPNDACKTAMTVAGSAPNYTLRLAAPGAANAGWADVTLNLGAAAAGNACTATGTANPAATTANVPWLQYNWTGAVGNPTARATFGVFRSGPIIHLREFY